MHNSIYLNEEVKFFVGCIVPLNSISSNLSDLTEALNTEFGSFQKIMLPTNGWKPPVSYSEEMGGNLSTIIFVFYNKCRIMEIVDRKKTTMLIEKMFSHNNRRTVNINPGFINKKGIYLASHKGKEHRSYLGQNIWLEKQLDWYLDSFLALSSTFSEYSHPERIHQFNHFNHLYYESILNKIKTFGVTYRDKFSGQPLAGYYQAKKPFLAY